MINLLPTKEKKRLGTEYMLRAWITFLWIIFFLGVFGTVLLLPSFIVSVVKEQSSKDKIINLQKREDFNINKETEKLIMDTNQKIETITPFLNNKFEASDIFKKILENKDTNIKIKTLSYGLGQDGVITIQIKGISNTRESLIQFLKKLETQDIFAKIDLPVSNFVKNKDLEFDFGLKIKNKI